jgi:hypothetical protein
MAQTIKDAKLIHANLTFRDESAENLLGSTRQVYKNIALINIPIGTTASEVVNSRGLDAWLKKPRDAGIMVVGSEPSNPPSVPPNFSIDTVANMAIAPANIATQTTDIYSMPQEKEEEVDGDTDVATLSHPNPTTPNNKKAQPDPLRQERFFIQSSSFIQVSIQ